MPLAAPLQRIEIELDTGALYHLLEHEVGLRIAVTAKRAAYRLVGEIGFALVTQVLELVHTLQPESRGTGQSRSVQVITTLEVYTFGIDSHRRTVFLEADFHPVARRVATG